MLLVIVLCVPAEATLLSSVPLNTTKLNVLNAADSVAWRMECREKCFV